MQRRDLTSVSVRRTRIQTHWIAWPQKDAHQVSTSHHVYQLRIANDSRAKWKKNWIVIMQSTTTVVVRKLFEWRNCINRTNSNKFFLCRTQRPPHLSLSPAHRIVNVSLDSDWIVIIIIHNTSSLCLGNCCDIQNLFIYYGLIYGITIPCQHCVVCVNDGTDVMRNEITSN